MHTLFSVGRMLNVYGRDDTVLSIIFYRTVSCIYCHTVSTVLYTDDLMVCTVWHTFHVYTADECCRVFVSHPSADSTKSRTNTVRPSTAVSPPTADPMTRAHRLRFTTSKCLHHFVVDHRPKISQQFVNSEIMLRWRGGFWREIDKVMS